MAASRIITVYGATGRQGSSVVESLLKNKSSNFSIRGITRNPDSDKSKSFAAQGAEMVKADGLDKASVLEAFRGSWAVFVNVNPDDPVMKQPGSPSEADLGKSLVDAAAGAGVKHFIFSGLASASKATDGAFPVQTFEDKFAIGEYAKTKGFQTTTVVSMGWYIENHFSEETAPLLGGFPYVPGEDGTFTLRMPHWGGNGKMPFISVGDDFGDIVHGVFLAPEEYDGRFVQVASQLAKPEEMVAAFTKVTGKKAQYSQLESWEAFETYGIDDLEPIKQMFGFLQLSGGKYFGVPDEIETASKLKASAARAQGLAENEGHLTTLEQAFRKQFQVAA